MSERAFKVGDRVKVGPDPRCNNPHSDWVDPDFAGRVGTIASLDSGEGYGVKVVGFPHSQIIAPECLTPAAEAPPPLRTRSIVLEVAKGLVNGDRQREYGTPTENLGRIAALWSVIFAREVTKSEVALALAALKIARLVQTPDSQDGWVDLAGYAAIGAEVSES